MYLKTVCFVIFLVLLQLFVEIKGNDEPLQSTSAKISAHIDSIVKIVEETFKNIKYITEHWQEILLVEQNEITRLRLQLDNILLIVRPRNEIKLITIEEVLSNENIILPSLKTLNNYLKNVISIHQKSHNPVVPLHVQRQILTQEIQLLSEIALQTRSSFGRVYSRSHQLPPKIRREIYQSWKWFEQVVRGTDSSTPLRFPTREELISNRNVILPIMENFRKLLNDAEAKYLQEPIKTPWIIKENFAQGLQVGQNVHGLQTAPIGQAGQAGVGAQTGQGKQAGLAGQGNQGGSTGLIGQTKRGGQSNQG